MNPPECVWCSHSWVAHWTDRGCDGQDGAPCGCRETPPDRPERSTRTWLRTRAERLRMPIAREVVEAVAIEHGVCIRPVQMRRVDLQTGARTTVPVPCGATLASACPPCAERARQLRMTQCREGWHLDTEPIPDAGPPTTEQRELATLRADLEQIRTDALAEGDVDEAGEAEALSEQIDNALAALGVRGSVAPGNRERPRRSRSTRRRQDAPDLPRRRVEPRTLGRTYTAPDGTVWRPSLFLTLTCDSYGRVRSDGTPVDPAGYDYRRAARDALHFPKLIDRFWQNLRRVVGYDVQYFATLEPQRRLAPHLHAAVRGTIPRSVLRQVAAATYQQIWWPRCDVAVYDTDCPPVWDDSRAAYVEPGTGKLLPTWDEALDAIAADAPPAHVARFGTQVQADGITAGSADIGRCVGYLAKYLTKSLDQCHTSTSDAERAHVDRLADALRYEPCAPTCANWLRYGIQPKDARRGLLPGYCKGKAHKRETLGFGGRRVLVSRKWSGKTLGDHRADRRAFVLATLGTDERPDQQIWQRVQPRESDALPRAYLILRAIADRTQWRQRLPGPAAVDGGDAR